jgi:NAD(P)-dependent dehydrogenase (short-subunit alcohol dehydrogenase family)
VNSSMAGKVALITGSGSGIGKATALKLAQLGVRLAVLERDKESMKETLEEMSHLGADTLELLADISDDEAMKEIMSGIKKRWNRLDFVVANAGVNGVWAPLDQIKLDEWDQTHAINVKGTFMTIRNALPLLKANGGSIVIVASVNGTRIFSNTGATAYSCSKAAQVAMAKMLAVEFGPAKIRVNVICPGAIRTKISESTRVRDLDKVKIPVEFPKGSSPLTGNEPGESENVAELIAFLISDAAKHVTGTEIYIDGGQSLLQG